MLVAAVEAGDIFEVVWVSLVAGAFVTTAFSFVVLGLARSAEAARHGHGTVALLYAGLAVVAFAAFAATVVLGVNIMLSKG
jgi:hypothetical protein